LVEEFVNVWDDDTNSYSIPIPRDQAHEEGRLHRVATVWLLSKYKDNIGIICQQRASDKYPFPGQMIMSAAGHVQSHPPDIKTESETALTAGYRELYEELGSDIKLSGELSSAPFSFEAVYSNPKGKTLPDIRQEWFGFFGVLPPSQWENVALNPEVADAFFLRLSDFAPTNPIEQAISVTDPRKKRIIPPDQFASPIYRHLQEISLYLGKFAENHAWLNQHGGDGSPPAPSPE
jgi:isopentenyldiphosphate isomerase